MVYNITNHSYTKNLSETSNTSTQTCNFDNTGIIKLGWSSRRLVFHPDQKFRVQFALGTIMYSEFAEID